MELIDSTCARHREALAQALAEDTRSRWILLNAPEPCRVCRAMTTNRDAYGWICLEYCEANSVMLTPESSEAVLKRLSEPAKPTPALRALLRGRCDADD